MKKTYLTLFVFVLGIIMIVGCSKSSGGKEPSGKEIDDGTEKLTISMAIPVQQGGGWEDKEHPTIKYIEEKFNVELDIRWVPGGNDYKNTLNSLAASKDLPDIYMINEPVQFRKWQLSGAFVDLKPYLEEFPGLANEFPEDAMEIFNEPGKIYGLPKYTMKYSNALWVRKDWLDKLGIPIPSPEEFTIDTFYEISKAFVEGDPDGNGKDDTVGFTNEFGTSTGLGKSRNAFLQAAYGIAYEWKEQDGKLVKMEEQNEEWKGLLTFLSKAYAEGVFDANFATNVGSDIEALVEGNKIGWEIASPGSIKQREEALKQIEPNAEFVMIPYPPKGPKGESGLLVTVQGRGKVVLDANMDEEKIYRILEWLEWWISEEGTVVMKDGPEGEIWEKKDGEIVLTEKGKTYEEQINLLNNWLFRSSDDNFNIHGWTPEEEQYDDEFQKAVDQYPSEWRDAGDPYTIDSPTFQERSKDLAADFNEGIANIIAGRKPVDYIDEVIERWKSEGGDKIIEEVNKSYQKQKNME
ncbi:type 2 periplasmic-binding domain-containing protein [Bacillus niameyensis]|uniref:extracellular solute-binding protein n=1 Tax=Bacillus niameyensis TaxID=1522308 RepID=UPI000783579A|nr:extracellular solute-binding protein [Bacillus niameyensis]